MVWLNRILGFSAGLLFLCGCASTSGTKFLVVDVPVADIRKTPVDREPGNGHDDLQETQVLFNEVLARDSDKGLWYSVKSLEQKKYSPGGKWQGYPGYVRKTAVRPVKAGPVYDSIVKTNSVDVYDALPPAGRRLFVLSVGTKIKTAGEQSGFSKIELGNGRFGWVDSKSIGVLRQVRDIARLRSDIMKTAELFLNSPYLWGGRSYSGVDCSGLVNLAYRANGIDLPRDSGDQQRMSKAITADELEPADLVFVSEKDDFGKIVHVMLYAGGEDLIESPETNKTVRRITFKDKFGMDLSELKIAGFIAWNRKIWLGSVIRGQFCPFLSTRVKRWTCPHD
jgi:cell wall-associated NlpC family hydrolase